MPEINIEKEIEKTMDKIIGTVGKKQCFILVHAHWCGHCHNIRPEWNDMKKKAIAKKKDVIEIESNVFDYMKKFTFTSDKKSKNAAVAEKNKKLERIVKMLIKEVQGYPTIIFINKSTKSNDFEAIQYNKSGGSLEDFLVTMTQSKKQ